MAGLRSSASYQWLSSDVLGQGATGGVYRGWDKKTGKSVAVKTFNSIGLQRPDNVQNREFDILRAINHPNIVRMFCVEEEEKTKESAIIMEICTGGSLYNVLEEPEFIYGLKEIALRKLIQDVTSGMSYLREKEIIHRDIKPGNILLSDKSKNSCWKLTDFGAARQLNNDSQFQSLYGTEEYLHPDMYQRAVLQNRNCSAWDATVDLWSLAVTFYHAATGFLPFRPYNGPRKNQATMGKMTKDRPRGAISATQANSVNGEIIWGYDLPKTCRLTGQFRRDIFRLISTLMDGCSFDDYFQLTDLLEGLTPVWTFECSTSRLMPIYMDSNNLVSTYRAVLKSELSRGISKENEEQRREKSKKGDFLVYRGMILNGDERIPKDTSTSNPIIALGTSDKGALHLPHTAKPPKIGKMISVDQDTQICRLCCGTLYDISRTVEYLTEIEKVATFASNEVQRVIEIEILRLKMMQTEALNDLSNAQSVAQTLAKLNLSGAAARRFNGAILKLVQLSTTLVAQRTQLEESLSDPDFPSLPDEIHNRTRQAAHEARDIYFDMKRRRSSRTVSPAEIAAHNGQRQRLSIHCTELVSLFAEQTFPLMKKRHSSSVNWFQLVTRNLRLMHNIASSTRSLKRECYELNDLSNQTIEEGKNKLEQVLQSDGESETQKVSENGVSNLSTVDIENIANLVQGELCIIRQLITTNQSQISKIKLQQQDHDDCDLNDAMIDNLQTTLLLN